MHDVMEAPAPARNKVGHRISDAVVALLPGIWLEQSQYSDTSHLPPMREFVADASRFDEVFLAFMTPAHRFARVEKAYRLTVKAKAEGDDEDSISLVARNGLRTVIKFEVKRPPGRPPKEVNVR